jgi:LAS superfamily LD-carboxypeptidase LdcB
VDLSTDGLVGHAFGNSAAGKWIAKNAHKFGFIMRYPKGKTDITGYNHEPWHFRYIGVKDAKAFAKAKSLTLEEYLGLA